MISHTKTIMKGLVNAPLDFMQHPVKAVSERRWISGHQDGPIVQLELFDDGKRGMLFAMTARDGSGPLQASFLTMLLLEDSFATVQTPYGVCSGEATITVYKYINLQDITALRLGQAIVDFAGTAEVVLGGYCGFMPTAPLLAEQEVA